MLQLIPEEEKDLETFPLPFLQYKNEQAAIFFLLKTSEQMIPRDKPLKAVLALS
jgi:hypothetical protein